MYQCTSYGSNPEEYSVLVVSPHSADGKEFFDQFPEIVNHPLIKSHWDLFEQYVEIERDKGADQLAHQLGHQLAQRGISSMVLEWQYPRAIVDGGRILSHCLRPCLPPTLQEQLNDRLLGMHKRSLEKLEELHQVINDRHGFVIDMHTMASFSPMNDGKIETKPVSFEGLRAYCQQFTDAPRTPDNLRLFDVITQDEDAREIAHPRLKKAIIDSLNRASIDFVENDPYCADSAFLMNVHLTRCPAIALDLPKHYVASVDNPMDFSLPDFNVDSIKVERIAKLIAEATKDALTEA
ncbi:hypothetical protein [Pseudobacteriovorax antillogorgiicola]|uniref:N-formylglutamate amidohydrolase n=1 Tax=Pseudobacteriovorax antillogorgiicola TaxID=1513793 RepID=A0A1Y6CUK8_9BACT|nr:hypothetical protein [Pseudobacteriovorax antillogorgiicola]TCS44603.1 hypothetical protein EDD56_13236 [Pseudobacteriovorax antillogorgiicola]SMF78190.1 hypothetical protein SAMN06296036_13236 [Pseudobacteriovorax antillogorgiicola]